MVGAVSGGVERGGGRGLQAAGRVWEWQAIKTCKRVPVLFLYIPKMTKWQTIKEFFDLQ